MTAAASPASHGFRASVLRPLTAAEVPNLLHALGDIPAERVLLDPPPGTATEEDVVRLVETANKVLCELIDGTLVEKTVGNREALLAVAIASVLRAFVVPKNLGIVLGADAMVRMAGGNVRLPDVSFVAWTDIPGGRIPEEAVGGFPVTLAVEVLSRGNPKSEMVRKRQEYFASGTRLVWEVDPIARTVAVYTSPQSVQVLDHTQTLDGGAVLVGFTLRLAELFAELDRFGSS